MTAAGLDDRKLATILFADLVGSTALAGRLDPETLRTIMMDYFDLMAVTIESSGGTVEKFIGDAVMAVFGVPTTHEDDARRALIAARDILARLAAFNDRLAQDFDVRLQVRIGVNTGEVIASRDASRREALVAGEVVNLAARLEQHAGPGEILVAADTAAAVGPLAVLGPRRDLAVKGKAGTIPAYPLLDVLPDEPEATRRFDLPFVGRARELATLDLALDRVVTDGTAGTVLMQGDPGIGKTRVLSEWLGRAGNAAGPPRAAVVRCRNYAEDGSLRPLQDLLAQLAGPDGAVNALAVSASPYAEAYAYVVERLEAAASSRPLVVVIDDCHWASTMLIEVLDRLAEDLADVPLMIVCAARREIAELFPSFGRGAVNFTSLELIGLGADDMMRLAAAFDDITAHDATALAMHVDRAEGNPLHLEQLLSAARDGSSPAELPPSVRALISARIDVLGETARLVLDGAAIIGREFSTADVTRLIEMPGGEPVVAAELRTLARRHLLETVRRAAGTAHRFASGLIHDAVYQAMTKGRRADLHLLYVEQLSERGATDAEIGGQLEQAYRCRAELGSSSAGLAAVRTSAAERLVAAGVTALRRVDIPWALNLFGRAVAVASPDDPQWPRATLQHGQALLAAGRRADALAAWREARESALRHGHAALAAHADLLAAPIDPDAPCPADVARRHLTRFENERDDLGIARARLAIAEESNGAGQHRAAVAELRAALPSAVRAGSDIERANALGALGFALWWGPQPADDAIAECVALLRDHAAGHTAVRATLGYPLAVLYAMAGDQARADAMVGAVRESSEALGHPEGTVFVPLLTAAVATLGDQGDAADAALVDADRAARRLASPYLRRTVDRALVRRHLDVGRADLAVAVLTNHTAAGSPSDRADLDGLAARVAAASDDAARAARHADAAVAVAAATDSLVALATAHLDVAHVHRLLGDPVRARVAADAAFAAYMQKGHLVGAGWAAALRA
ncbi:adenylate/guanylate cyclase domain-containing protein [Micromonospora carbonacea]|uniref:adenylate/guanylate cyclase domain-containing protein n=1 Tax=Micromonospora carbonacea TaxID=47853 RepID=UPI0037153A8F